MTTFWLTGGTLVMPHGLMRAAVGIKGSRIVAIRSSAPAKARRISVRGAYLAPGFIDLHVWGELSTISLAAAQSGTTAFLTTLAPAPSWALVAQLARLDLKQPLPGAACLGAHLEGPFLNPARGGALPRRWMRRPLKRELRALFRAGAGRLKVMTMAPELPGGAEAIRECVRHRIVASLGHTDADAQAARRAVEAGAKAVTHVFNGMRPLHHRESSLLDVALADPRLTTMVILDGIHISPSAFRLLVRTKGVQRIALTTDSIRHAGWDVIRRRGAFYTRRGILAGSDLTMMDAVRNAVTFAGLALTDAVRMASEVPARLLGLRDRGVLATGRRADLVAFDRHFRVLLTLVGGRVVFQRGHSS